MRSVHGIHAPTQTKRMPVADKHIRADMSRVPRASTRVLDPLLPACAFHAVYQEFFFPREVRAEGGTGKNERCVYMQERAYAAGPAETHTDAQRAETRNFHAARHMRGARARSGSHGTHSCRQAGRHARAKFGSQRA